MKMIMTTMKLYLQLCKTLVYIGIVYKDSINISIIIVRSVSE